MITKKHLTIYGLHNIISIAATINNGSSLKVTAAFPKIISINHPVSKLIIVIPNKYWLVHFVTSDGSFSAYYLVKQNRLKIKFIIT